MKNELIIDATGGILGRIASYTAKQVLLGKEVRIINCSEALLTGRRGMIIARYKKIRAMGGSSQKGPIIPKSAERIMKKTVRGMLPHKKGKGSEALDRLKCYNKVPKELEEKEKIYLKRDLKVKAMKLANLVENL